jgi:hypothetical protein
MPPSDDRWCELAKFKFAEGRNDVQSHQSFVELLCPRPQPAVLQPGVGIVGQRDATSSTSDITTSWSMRAAREIGSNTDTPWSAGRQGIAVDDLGGPPTTNPGRVIDTTAGILLAAESAPRTI